MCEDCFEEYGRPMPDAAALAAVPLIAEVFDEDVCGGNLHIMIEDWNIDDEHIAMCRTGVATPAEAACLEAFEKLTESQRAAALGAFYEFDSEDRE